MGQGRPSRIPRYGATPGSRPWFMVSIPCRLNLRNFGTDARKQLRQELFGCMQSQSKARWGSCQFLRRVNSIRK